MGCGASKDGAGGVTGDKPNKNSDPMVISWWREAGQSAKWPSG